MADGAPTSVSVSGVSSFGALGEAWRALEAEAAAPSFFQSWTWVGCLAEERYDRPVLVRAERGGRLAGLALFNRRGRWLHLSESGRAELDAPFVERNAPLVAAGDEEGTRRALLAAAWRVPGIRGVVLGGTPAALPGLCDGVPLRRQERVAPFVRLDRLRETGQEYLDTLSANTRYQLRRSLRHYCAFGELEARAAATEAEALGWFETLVRHHQATWTGRGQPGAFAGSFMLRFHRALIARAAARGELDLVRVAAGQHEVGFLYNLRSRGWVHAYQSGFRYDAASQHARPGLTCHYTAIGQALRRGDLAYDFLGGADRYKRSLANDEDVLVWSQLVPRRSPGAVAARLRSLLQRWRPDGW